jgi:rhodanese-related sulfurtransferase
MMLAATAFAAGPPIAPADLDALLHAPNAPLIVDVRTPDEFRVGHIAGALNVQHDTIDEARWAATHSERDDEVVLYCGTGRRAGIAQQTLESMGWYHTRVLTGGIEAWTKAGLPLVIEQAAKVDGAQ